MKVITILLLIFLGGCAPRGPLVWEHSQGYNDKYLRQAQQECRQLAHREARRTSYSYYYDPLFPFYRPFNYHDRYYGPNLFWHDHFGQLRYQEDLSRLYRICMEAKGWRLVRVKTADQNTEGVME